jgi:pyridoxamine 5'-phosphate oxidase
MQKKLLDLRKEYLYAILDEQSALADPLGQFEQWFEEAFMSGVVETNAMILSTATQDGRVSARVVLLKGVENESFIFFSNYHSRKGLQLNGNGFAALTFHWKELERQVRIEGYVKKLNRHESQIYFNSRPLESRISACISPQSAVVPDRQFLEAMRDGFVLDLNGQQPKCPINWGGYRVDPHLIEFWQGRANRLHDRLQYCRSGKKWVIERLAP